MKSAIFFFFFLLVVSVVLFIQTPAKESQISEVEDKIKEIQEEITPVKREQKIAKPVEVQKETPKEKTTNELKLELTYTLDDMKEENITLKPEFEIKKLMQEQNKLEAHEHEKQMQVDKKNSEWEVDYEVGLEDGSLERLKNERSLKADMLNGKVGFIKSF